MKRALRRVAKLALIGALAWFFPVFMAVLFACGLYDFSRNRPLSWQTAERYFLGNGLLTWLLSPFNGFLDLLALPFVNKGIYRIDDFPPAYQAEIRRLIAVADGSTIIEQIAARAQEQSRTMVFMKWYGANVDSFLDVPGYREPFRYIQTIGVSVFNKKQSTSKHFGPFRPTLRILYNLNDVMNRAAHIDVGGTRQYWQDEKLFIFDDTLQHQSFNESDDVRYCLFVDILRPAGAPMLLAAVVRLIRRLLKGVNFLFYKNWKVIAR